MDRLSVGIRHGSAPAAAYIAKKTGLPRYLGRVLERLIPAWATQFELRQGDGKLLQTAKVKLVRGVFQGDALSALLFCLATALGSRLGSRLGYRM